MSVPEQLRRRVYARAGGKCEYCRLPDWVLPFAHHVDHIGSIQHGGSSDPDNLCLCCHRCNRKKGPNLSSIDPISQDVVRLFNPRWHDWHRHFEIRNDGEIFGTTPEGRATVRLLDFNQDDRVLIRSILLHEGQL